jgi:hypothetical protein
MTHLQLPKALARHTQGARELDVAGRTLQEALSTLTSDHGLGTAILREDGSLQPYVRIVIDQELLNAASLADLNSVVVEGKTVQLKTAFAGG